MAVDTHIPDRVRELRAAGYSPKQIAKALDLRPAVAARFVRSLATEEAEAAPESAVVGCWVSPGWSAHLTVDGPAEWVDVPMPDEGMTGLAAVVVARRHRPQRVSVCGYLVDTYCLGVKNTLGPELMNERDLPGFRRRFFASFEAIGEPLAAPLELAQHLVWGAVDHARRLGFEPAADFRHTAGHLGEWTETSRITFGRDGVPFYMSGPYDNPRAVIRTLDTTCGEGNYHYVVGTG